MLYFIAWYLIGSVSWAALYYYTENKITIGDLFASLIMGVFGLVVPFAVLLTKFETVVIVRRK